MRFLLRTCESKSKQFQIEQNFHHGLQQHVDLETWWNGAIESQVSFVMDFDWPQFCFDLFRSMLEFMMAHTFRYPLKHWKLYDSGRSLKMWRWFWRMGALYAPPSSSISSAPGLDPPSLHINRYSFSPFSLNLFPLSQFNLFSFVLRLLFLVLSLLFIFSPLFLFSSFPHLSLHWNPVFLSA